MKEINKDTVLLKNLLGLIDNPNKFDLLYEIVNFLSEENRFDGDFTMREVSLKTKFRESNDLETDLENLINEGYIEKTRKTSYRVLKHKWE